MHDFAARIIEKSCMSSGACHHALDLVVGMTRLARPRVYLFAECE